MAAKTKGYLTFRVGHEWYGVNVNRIIEVLHLVALNEVPGSDVVGVMTLRDQVIPVIDLRERFGVEELNFKLDTPIIAIRGENGPMGLIVDEADDVELIEDEQITTYADRFVHHVVRLDGKLLFLLDIAQLSEVDFYAQPGT